MTDIHSFYSALGVELPPSSSGANVAIACFTNPNAHRHDDKNKSASVSVESGAFHCHACGAHGGAYDAALALGKQPAQAMRLLKDHGLVDDNAQPQRPVAPTVKVTDAQIRAYGEKLLAADGQVAKLATLRGWSRETIEQFEVGVDASYSNPKGGGAIVFPSRDEAGMLTGCVHYAPDPAKRNGSKSWAEGPRQLYPAPEAIDGKIAWLVEGEGDALAAWSIGLPGVGVPGVEGFKDAWAQRFERFESVVVCTDDDEAGSRLAERLARALAPVVEVRRIDLREWLTGDQAGNGFDLSDLVLEAAQNGGGAHLKGILEDAAGHAKPEQPSKPAQPELPAVEPTTTAELLEKIGKVLQRFVVLPNTEATAALSLFVLHTWAIEAAHATPYVAIISPEKQSGKTKLLEVLELLVRQPWRTASCTEAALFRKIEQSTPTLLLDEIDALFNSNTERTEPLRAVLNAGNLRGSCATRVVGQGTKMEAQDFSTFCPKVLAGINTGKLPETIKDRAVILDMKRRVAGEHVDRLRHRFVVEEMKPLRDELEAWAAGVVDLLGAAVPELPRGAERPRRRCLGAIAGDRRPCRRGLGRGSPQRGSRAQRRERRRRGWARRAAPRRDTQRDGRPSRDPHGGAAGDPQRRGRPSLRRVARRPRTRRTEPRADAEALRRQASNIPHRRLHSQGLPRRGSTGRMDTLPTRRNGNNGNTGN